MKLWQGRKVFDWVWYWGNFTIVLKAVVAQWNSLGKQKAGWQLVVCNWSNLSISTYLRSLTKKHAKLGLNLAHYPFTLFRNLEIRVSGSTIVLKYYCKGFKVFLVRMNVKLTPRLPLWCFGRAMVVFVSRAGIQGADDSQITVLAVALTFHYR